MFAQVQTQNNFNDSLKGKKDIIDIVGPIFLSKDASKGRSELNISNKKFYFSLLPSSAGIPGGGTAFITTTNISYYLGDKKTTKLSSINITPYTNFIDRYGISFRSNIWLKNNSWNLLGDFRLLVYPQNSWGLGGSTQKGNEVLINYNYSRFYESALKKIAPNVFAGIGISYDHHSHIKAEGDSSFYNSIKPYYDTLEATSYSTGITFNLQFDSRDNTTNPERGFFASAKYRFNPVIFCNTGSWTEWFFDVRKYLPLSNKSHEVLAFWSFWWVTHGSYIPYLDLPSTMWDSYARSGRGFMQGRYKSDKELYLEAEYRRDLTANGLLGLVLFANLQSFSEFNTTQYKYWHPAIGSGLRVKFNKFSKTNIVLDYAFSKEYSTYYINISETF
jgi:outer membrane protein assembly factor BamA